MSEKMDYSAEAREIAWVRSPGESMERAILALLDKVRQEQAAEIGKLAKDWRDRQKYAGCKGEASVYPLLADELEAALGRK